MMIHCVRVSRYRQLSIYTVAQSYSSWLNLFFSIFATTNAFQNTHHYAYRKIYIPRLHFTLSLSPSSLERTSPLIARWNLKHPLNFTCSKWLDWWANVAFNSSTYLLANLMMTSKTPQTLNYHHSRTQVYGGSSSSSIIIAQIFM